MFNTDETDDGETLQGQTAAAASQRPLKCSLYYANGNKRRWSVVFGCCWLALSTPNNAFDLLLLATALSVRCNYVDASYTVSQNIVHFLKCCSKSYYSIQVSTD